MKFQIRSRSPGTRSRRSRQQRNRKQKSRQQKNRQLRNRKQRNSRKENRMGIFEKKVLIYRKRDRQTWEKIRKVLSEEGIRFRASHYEQDNIPVGGYSAMDPRNFGKGGRIDRQIYTVSVKESAAQSAGQVLRGAGIVAQVEDIESLTQDASKKFKDIRY